MTARIPWPNPLTAAVGLSVESLHLTFNVVPTVSKDKGFPVNLAESVTSIAETFIHDELDPAEEAALRDSIHPDLPPPSPPFNHVPGGLDPFITEDATQGDSDPQGVSIFATLLERLLSRFQFDATDVKVTLVHPGHASFTITIPKIQYQTEVKGESPTAGSASLETQDRTGDQPGGTTRTVRVEGVTVTTRCLRTQSPVTVQSPSLSVPPLISRRDTPSPENLFAPPRNPSPPSPGLSDSSELDEEVHMMMSQSLVGLPPRLPSPTSSVASSMYQSAVSLTSVGASSPPVFRNSMSLAEPEEGRVTPTSPMPHAHATSPPRPTLKAIADEIQDETILSFGADPIVVRLLTPTPRRQAPSQSSASSPAPEDANPHGRRRVCNRPSWISRAAMMPYRWEETHSYQNTLRRCRYTISISVRVGDQKVRYPSYGCPWRLTRPTRRLLMPVHRQQTVHPRHRLHHHRLSFSSAFSHLPAGSRTFLSSTIIQQL